MFEYLGNDPCKMIETSFVINDTPREHEYTENWIGNISDWQMPSGVFGSGSR